MERTRLLRLVIFRISFGFCFKAGIRRCTKQSLYSDCHNAFGVSIEDVSGLVQDGTEPSIFLIVWRQWIYRRTETLQIWLQAAHQRTFRGSAAGDRIGSGVRDSF